MENIKKRNRILEFLPLVLVSLALIGMIIFPEECSKSAKSGLTLCLDVIVPSLFPFFVISSLATELGLAQYVGAALENITQKLFGISGNCTSAFILGLLGGFPLGAKTAISLYQKNLCSKSEAERLLTFCNNTGPAFIFGALATGIFRNVKIGLIIYISHILAAITGGIIFRFLGGNISAEKSAKAIEISKSKSFPKAFGNSLKNSVTSLINICSVVIFFTVAVKMLTVWNIIPFMSGIIAYPLSFFNIGRDCVTLIITGFIEMTTGVFSLISAAMPITSKACIASLLIGWSGLSVHCQVLSLMSECDLSFSPYIKGKLLSSILNMAYTSILIKFIPFTVSTAINTSKGIADISLKSVSMPLSFLSAILMWFAFLVPCFIKSLVNKKFQK